jgi:hypothetical protein
MSPTIYKKEEETEIQLLYNTKIGSLRCQHTGLLLQPVELWINSTNVVEISGSHGSEYAGDSLLGCCAM